jgi:hypothetical protein
MFLRFLRIGAKIGLGCGFFGLIFLVPIYATARDVDFVVGIKRCSMANLRDGGTRLWASLWVVYIYTGLLLYLLYKEYEFFVGMRQRFLRDGDPDIPPQQFYSVVVENIPCEYRSSKRLAELFNDMFPGEVVSARIAMNYAPILKAAKERKGYLVKLELAIAAFEATDHEKVPMVKLDKKRKPIMCCGKVEEVEAIPFYEAELERMNKKITELKQQAAAVDGMIVTDDKEDKMPQEKKKNEPNEKVADLEAGEDQDAPETLAEVQEEKDEKEEKAEENNFTVKSICSSGFVTFRSRRAQAASYQLTLLSDKYPRLKAFQAQSTQNILWYNTNADLDYIKFASSLTSCGYIAGLIFWGVILAGISGISSLSNLSKILPFLASLPTAVNAILAGQLPVIILIVFISLIPTIINAVSCYVERQKTKTDAQIVVCKW